MPAAQRFLEKSEKVHAAVGSGVGGLDVSHLPTVQPQSGVPHRAAKASGGHGGPTPFSRRARCQDSLHGFPLRVVSHAGTRQAKGVQFTPHGAAQQQTTTNNNEQPQRGTANTGEHRGRGSVHPADNECDVRYIMYHARGTYIAPNMGPHVAVH